MKSEPAPLSSPCVLAQIHWRAFRWTLLLLALPLLMLNACKGASEKSSGLTSSSDNETVEEEVQPTLAQSIVGELRDALSKSTQAQRRASSKAPSTSLTSSQIGQIIEAANASISEAGLEASENLVLLLPKIVEGAQVSLSRAGLANSAEATRVIQVLVNSMIRSLKGRSAYLPVSAVDDDLTSTETVLHQVTMTSIAYLDEAGLTVAEVASASSAVVGTVVASLGESGMSTSEVGGGVKQVTSGAIDALDEVGGLDINSLGGVVESITGGATSGLGDIEMEGFTSGKLTEMVGKVTAGATGALGKVEMPGYSADNLSPLVEKVSAGATASLGKALEKRGLDAGMLPDLMEQVTAGAIGALDEIEMEGYDSSKLGGMVEQVTAGATVALGRIEMDGFDVDDVATLMEKATSGASSALANIQMEGFSAADLDALAEKARDSANSSLSKIEINGLDATRLQQIKEKISSGVNSGKAKRPPMLAEVRKIPSPTSDKTPSYIFSSSKSGTLSFRGPCSSETIEVLADNNTIVLHDLSDGTYRNCALQVTDTTGNVSEFLKISAFTIDTSTPDTDPPVLKEVIAIPEVTNDRQALYTFSSSEDGTLILKEGCFTQKEQVFIGNNTLVLDNLSDGLYEHCTVQVTDEAENTSELLTVSEFRVDVTPPVLLLSKVSQTNSSTPQLDFFSTEDGTITYHGACSSDTRSAITGLNSITFDSLDDGVYSDCALQVTDSAGNTSDNLSIDEFTIGVCQGSCRT